MPTHVLINDSSVNAYGFRVLTSGIRTDNYTRNPIGFYNHDRDKGVILRGENLKKENDCLFFTPVFDLKHPIGAEVGRQYEEQFLNAFSIGIADCVFDRLNEELVVTSCSLVEVSLVDIPANKNAVRLYEHSDGGLIQLSDIQLNNLLTAFRAPFMPEEHQNSMKNISKFILLFASLGINLADNAGEDELLSQVSDLVNKYKSLRDAQLAERNLAVEKLLDTASADGRIQTPAQRTAFKALADSNYPAFCDMLESLSHRTSLSDSVRPTGKAPEATAPKTFADLIAKGHTAIESFKLENPQKYAELYQQHYKTPLI